MVVPLGPAMIAASTLGSTAMQLFGGKDSVSQQPLETPEQTSARQSLLQFGNSGYTPWGYNVTQPYSGALGNYSMTPLESQGQGVLSSFVGQNPDIFNAGKMSLRDLLSTSAYDPNNDGGVYKGLTAGIDYNANRAIDATKQGLAYQGNLYSTSASRSIGDINAQTANQKSNILAQLYQNFTNQKLQGASTAINAGAQENQMKLSQVAASQQYGMLARTLADNQAKDAYSAWLTQKQSELQPISALTSVLGSTPNYGVQDIPVASPWNQLLNTLSQTGGYLTGMQYGYPSTSMTQPPVVAPNTQSFAGANLPSPYTASGTNGFAGWGNN